MSRITFINLMKLKQDEMLNFNKVVLSVVGPHCSGHKSFQRFEEEAKRLESLTKSKAFKESTSLMDLDREADMSWVTLSHHLKASVRHPSEEIREASKKIYAIFEQTDNPTKLNYEQEYGALQRLLSQLDELPEEIFEKTHTKPYLEALREAVSSFMRATENKIDILSKQQIGVTKEVMTSCYKAWQGLSKYLEVVSEYEEAPAILEIVDKLNALCMGIKRRLDNRKQAGDSEAIDIEDIALA